MSNSVRPHRQQSTRLLCPWDSPGENAGVGCHFLLQCMKVKSESEVAQSCPTHISIFRLVDLINMNFICWRRDRLPTPVFLGFPCGSDGEEFICNAEDLGLIPELGRSPGGGKGYPLQYSGLENSMDYTVHGVAKSWTRLSDCHFHFPFFIEKLLFFMCESGSPRARL